MVFRGDDGLDELTTTATSQVWEVRDGRVTAGRLDPVELGLPRAQLDDLRGGGVEENVAIADAVLAGEPGPRADVVALNAGAALLVAGDVTDLPAGIARAREVLTDGSARSLRDRWVARSSELAPR